MIFNKGQMPVFDRTGSRIGTLTTWAITKTRTFRINETEDFSFVIPQRDENGDNVLTQDVLDLLKMDNIIYIENELLDFPGWGGAISQVTMENGGAWVDVIGGFGLLDSIDTTAITQNGGESASIARSLIEAANAKKSAHGDLTIGFVRDDSTPNYGTFTYEGNVLQGVQRLAEDSLSEFYMVSEVNADGSKISFTLHWSDRLFVDYRGVPTFFDGPDGNIIPGAKLIYSGLETINHVRLKGATTQIGDYVAYSAVKNVINEITPEIEYEVFTEPNVRRREDLSLTVNFGYGEEIQRGLANQIQEQYVQFYKQFLYAHHNRQGRPFLDGYDWEGPGGKYSEKVLNRTSYKTLQKLGRIGSATVIVAPADDVTIDTGAMIDGWVYDTSIAVTQAVGIAISWVDDSNHIIADGWNNSLNLYVPATDTDPAELNYMYTVGAAGEYLVGVATDSGDVENVWCLFNKGSDTVVRWYDIDEGTLNGVWTITGVTANDISVDVASGLVYLVGESFSTVMVRYLANGLAIDPDPSFAAGFTESVTGISNAGGISYVIDAKGHVRMLYLTTGGLAGTFDTGKDANGIFVDPENKRVYLVNTDGSISVYHANIAVATVDPPSGSVSAPAFGEILKGQFVHIVMVNNHAHSSSNTAGAAGTYTVKHGDTLWAISKKYYGSGTSWRTIYNANKAQIEATAKSHGFADSDHGHWIWAGENLIIPGYLGGTSTPPTPASHTRYLMCYTKADWVTRHEGDPIDGITPTIKEWELKGDQVVGTVMSSKCHLQDPAVVVYGEEGRVNDWDPVRDGYGEYLEDKVYRTKSGRVRHEGAGWYPRDWDVVDTAWHIDKPDWPEGEAYLAAYIRRRNAEVTVQSFTVINRDNLWNKIKLGGVYTLDLSLQGVVPGGTTVDVRVLGFAPAELVGTCEITAETYIP